MPESTKKKKATKTTKKTTTKATTKDTPKEKAEETPPQPVKKRTGRRRRRSAKLRAGVAKRNLLKPIIYALVLAGLLYAVDFFFGYAPADAVPWFLVFMEIVIRTVNPFLVWVYALVIFTVGILLVNAIGTMIYDILDERSESSASSLKTMVRIVGYGVLIAILVSMLNVDPTAAIAIASFLGIAIGFAGQSVLGEILAGIVVVINRPIKPGELVTIAGRTGVVKEVSLTRVRIELPGGKNSVLIPSSVILKSNILRSRREDE